ncbi:MAG: sialidase family protein [Nitrososphaeraceae archaeon]
MYKNTFVFGILIFTTLLLLIPATSLVNAQRTSYDLESQEFELSNENLVNKNELPASISAYNINTTSKSSFSQPTSSSIPSSISTNNMISSSYFADKENVQYYYDYPLKNKDYNKDKQIQECKECFLHEIKKIYDKKLADQILKDIKKEFGDISKLCKLIVNGHIDKEELEHILYSVLFGNNQDQKKYDSYYSNDDDYYYDTNVDDYNDDYYNDDYYNQNKKDHSYSNYKFIDVKIKNDFIQNVLECLFQPPIIYVVWPDDTPGNNDIFFSFSTDNGVTFSQPDNISNNDGNSNSPQIAVQGDNVYVVWRDNTPGTFDTFFSFSTDNGASFSQPDNISNQANFSFGPQIAVQGDNVYIVWDNDGLDIFFSFSTDNGVTFSQPDNISNSGFETGNPQIAAKYDNVYIVWDDEGGDLIKFSFSTDNGQTFSPPVDLSTDENTSQSPQIALNRDNIYVVWQDFAPGNSEIFFSFSTDNGQTFSQPENISNSDDTSQSQQIAAKGNNVYVVWRDETPGNFDTFFSFSTDNGVSFSQPDNISNNDGDTSVPKIAIGGHNVYIVWEDDTPGNNDILFSFSTNNGQTFSQPDNISNNDGDSENPGIATQGNNVYVVWRDDTPGNFDTFFSFSTNNGQTFSQPENISNNDGDSGSPQIEAQ